MTETKLPPEIVSKLNALTEDQRASVKRTYESRKKSIVVAYILWMLFGGVCGHRLYLGDRFSSMLLRVAVGGFAAYLIDAFLLWKVVRRRNALLFSQLIEDVYEKAYRSSKRAA